MKGFTVLQRKAMKKKKKGQDQSTQASSSISSISFDQHDECERLERGRKKTQAGTFKLRGWEELLNQLHHGTWVNITHTQRTALVMYQYHLSRPIKVNISQHRTWEAVGRCWLIARRSEGQTLGPLYVESACISASIPSCAVVFLYFHRLPIGVID